MDGLKRPRSVNEPDEHYDKRARTDISDPPSFSARLGLAPAPLPGLGSGSGPGPGHSNGNGTVQLANMTDITRRFQAAVQDGWSRRLPTYADVFVLMLVWEEDDAEVGPGLAYIDSIFRSFYHFNTEVWKMVGAKPHEALKAKVIDFLRQNNSPSNLLILYYAGNAKTNPLTGQAPLWTPRRPSSSLAMPSGPIQALFEDTLSDVLLILDCLNAYHTPINQETYGMSRRAVTEVLTAPTLEGPVNASGEPTNVFAQALYEELSAACKSGPLKIVDLHGRLTSRLKLRKPRPRGRPPKDPQARPSEDQHLLPLHYWLSNTKRSIMLAPLPPRNEGQVVLCLRVIGGGLDVSEWGKWIYQAPPESRDMIKIEGLYSGFSTMIVLRVPVAMWHLLPDCPAGSFVAFTTTGPIAPEMQKEIEDSLAPKLMTEGDFSDLPPARRPPPEEEDGYSLRSTYPKKVRKALPSGRKLLPSEPIPLAPVETREFAPMEQQQEGYNNGDESSQLLPSPTERKALPTARKAPVKISIKSATQPLQCTQCKMGMKTDDELANHMRKAHTRPFYCVFNWAGCESTFGSKNEWKRHVMSQHILLNYWLCELDSCAKMVNSPPGGIGRNADAEANGSGRPRGPVLPNGAIFNRKDLYTQHLRRMHTPPSIKKLMKQQKLAPGKSTATNSTIQEWEEHLHELQGAGFKERVQLPTYMRCPAAGCDMEFTGNNAWDDRMEHVAKHLERVAAGQEPQVLFGGDVDETLTGWATRPEVGIVRRLGDHGWQLENPLRQEVLNRGPGDQREREKSVIEVAEDGGGPEPEVIEEE